jgi:hypothetical protein
MQLEGLQSLSGGQPAKVRPNLTGVTIHTPLPGTLSVGFSTVPLPGRAKKGDEHMENDEGINYRAN